MARHDGSTPAGQRVLTAASTLFYREGINAVGVAAIAEAAGVTKKTLYDSYGSKANLVVAYLRQRHATWWAYLEKCLTDARPPRVLAVFEAYLDHPDLDSSRGCGFLNAAAELPADHPGRAVIAAHKAAVRRLLVDLLREDRPDLDRPDTLAEHLFLLLEGAIAHRGLDAGTERLHRARHLAESLLAR